MIELTEAVSPYKKYCDGYGNPGTSGKGYFIGLTLGATTCDMKFSHGGSIMPDRINAFDKAESGDVYLGQINMITVSSFCGPNGTVWGYDVVRPRNLFTPHSVFVEEGLVGKDMIPLYSADPLIDATRSLFGTVDEKKFPLMPGAHVPCAKKSIERVGPSHIYAAIALGIAKNPETDAHLLMEDVGEIPISTRGTDEEKVYKDAILVNLVKSVKAIGKNQRTDYKEIFISIKDVVVRDGQIGCALLAVPYFTLAKDAIPPGGIETLRDLTLHEWKDVTK